MLQKEQPTLKEVQQQFEEWRRGGKRRRDRIPSALWDAAASLSGQYSVHEISKRLRLNHTALRDRVAACRGGNGSRPETPAFIELDMVSPKVAAECTIDMEKPGGARMKITIKGNCPDIAGISKAFLG